MYGKKESRNLRSNIISRAATTAVAILIAFAAVGALSQSSQVRRPATGLARGEKVLHSFDQADGSGPNGSLIFDATGNLYGTTGSGGDTGNGTVFELTPASGGHWTEQVLHNFGHGTDGIVPTANLIFDAAGKLYGTTVLGGDYRLGTVFELTPAPGGGWTERVLYSFGGSDGTYPYTGLVFDTAGKLYGTTSRGGGYDGGTVFELTPTADGDWTEQVLYSFGNGTDGNGPSSLIFDSAGNLYGATGAGGTYGSGIAFELTPTPGGGWTEQVLHNFDPNSDGSRPSGLIFDGNGNLYGATAAQGAGYGTIGTAFELSPILGGGWTVQVLHGFNAPAGDGWGALSGLIFDAAGNLYGTTQYGGMYNGGTVFELTPNGDGSWTETLPHSFGNGTDGHWPLAGVILDSAGNLYGTTEFGGTNYCLGQGFGCGVVYEVTNVYPCAPCSHSASREADVLSHERRD